MTATKDQTVIDWIKGLSTSSQSDKMDSKLMQALLRRIGYPKAVVVSGIVYLEGHGTLNAPPQSINKIAKTIYEAIKDVK